MAHSGFASRFGYVRWLLHLSTGREPRFSDIAKMLTKALDRPKNEPVVSQTVSGWAKRETFPDSREFSRALPQVLGVSEEWLIEGSGESPRPELWKWWAQARKRRTRTMDIGWLVAAAQNNEHEAAAGNGR